MNGANQPAETKAHGSFTVTEYCITCIDKHDCHIGGYTTYGIAARAACGQLRSLFEDVSANRETAQKFVNICNLHSVSELHLFDVLYDFLIS